MALLILFVVLLVLACKYRTRRRREVRCLSISSPFLFSQIRSFSFYIFFLLSRSLSRFLLLLLLFYEEDCAALITHINVALADFADSVRLQQFRDIENRAAKVIRAPQ